MNRRLFLHLWLAFLLIFTQQGAFAHALSHLQENTPAQSHSERGKQLPHHDVCPQCAAYGDIGNGVSPFHFPLVPVAGGITLAATPAFTFSPVSFPAYLSRAPPACV